MTFDFRNPDYVEVMNRRLKTLTYLREHPDELPIFKEMYRQSPADFINDWGVTYDPRNAERGLLTMIPFVLFPRQRDWIDWILLRWRSQGPGLCEKSRDMGISWLSTALACSLCLFNRGVAIGFGSRKEEYVDRVGTIHPLLPKARMFLENIPDEFKGSWKAWRDAPYMRINFPETGSIIRGEAGDQIGRGDRASIYFVDEAAHLERPDLVEMSLSQTTNCRIDMSSVNGMNNPFAQKRHGGKVDVFVFDWREDPRKDDAWYAKQCAELDPVVVAQEIDRDYSASVSGIVIPGTWVRAAIDVRSKLGLPKSGAFLYALDIADEGLDKNAFVGGQGIEISVAQEWSGKNSDTFFTVEKAFELADEHHANRVRYDSDGMGALVRGDARVINDRRKSNNAPPVSFESFRSSDAVFQPEGVVEGTIGIEGKGRKNQDYFANRKAQGWWALRKRFQKTFRWVNDGIPCNPDDIISIDSKMPNAMKLVTELSQPTYQQNGTGKMVINKKPDGMKSPNLADGAMMRFAPNEAPALNITGELLMQLRRAANPRHMRRRS